MRPAAWTALILTVALLVACPALPSAVFTAVGWLLSTPLAAGAALAATLVWIAMRPDAGRRWA